MGQLQCCTVPFQKLVSYTASGSLAQNGKLCFVLYACGNWPAVCVIPLTKMVTYTGTLQLQALFYYALRRKPYYTVLLQKWVT